MHSVEKCDRDLIQLSQLILVTDSKSLIKQYRRRQDKLLERRTELSKRP